MLRSGQEALDVGAALGHPVLPIFGLTGNDVAHSNRVVDLLLETLLKGFTLPTHQDDCPSRLDEGAPQRSERSQRNRGRRGEAARPQAPVNAAIVEMALEIESGRLKPDPANIRLLAKRVRELERRTIGENRMVGVALVGLGWWGRKMGALIKKQARELELVRAVEPNAAAAKEVGAELGVPITADLRRRSLIRRSARSFSQRRMRCTASRSDNRSPRGSTCSVRSRWR